MKGKFHRDFLHNVEMNRTWMGTEEKWAIFRSEVVSLSISSSCAERKHGFSWGCMETLWVLEKMGLMKGDVTTLLMAQLCCTTLSPPQWLLNSVVLYFWSWMTRKGPSKRDNSFKEPPIATESMPALDPKYFCLLWIYCLLLEWNNQCMHHVNNHNVWHLPQFCCVF